MRRTTVLVGVAALAVGFSGVAGPANAAETQDARIMVVEPMLIEVAVDLDAGSPAHDINEDYAVLENFGTAGDLDGFQLWGCDTTGDFEIVNYGQNDVIGSGSTPFHLTADSSYSGGPTEDTNGDFTRLDQSNGGIYLRTDGGTLVNGVFWGSPTCTPAEGPNFVEANNPPTDHASLHKQNGSWDVNTPDPRNTLSS